MIEAEWWGGRLDRLNWLRLSLLCFVDEQCSGCRIEIGVLCSSQQKESRRALHVPLN